MNRNITFGVFIAAGVLTGLASYSLPAEACDPVPAAQTDEGVILYWVAPMDPDYKRDKPGKSPMGMDLVPVYAEKASEKLEDGTGIKHSGEGMHMSGGWGETDESGHEAHANKREPMYWVAPMDPNYKSDKPGKSPMGMDLIPVYAKDEGGRHGDKAATDSLHEPNNNGSAGTVRGSGHTGDQHE